ncbi:MAG: AAA family ATPase [Hyphomicrobiales bacterium]
MARIVVLAGPPCSGKSTLARGFKGDSHVYMISMDEVRQLELPDSTHSKPDRDFAYRSMHARAASALQAGIETVVLDATYGPDSHRRALRQLAEDFDAGVFLVECRIHPDEAVYRYRTRSPLHAGIDLDEARVRRLAATYPYSGCGLVLDTSSHREALLRIHASKADHQDVLFQAVSTYLARDVPVHSTKEWTGELLAPSHPDWTANPAAEVKQSPWSRRRALEVMAEHGLVVGFAMIVAVIGFALLVRAWLASSTLQDRDYIIATAWLSAGIMSAALFAMAEFLARPSWRNARSVARAVRTITYGEMESVQLSDTELRQTYVIRTSPKSRSRFAIERRPIYFVIPPQADCRFNVVVGDFPVDNWNSKELARRALIAGFDWGSYDKWRRHDKGSEYYGPTRRWEPVVRVCGLTTQSTNGHLVYEARIGQALYGDYLVAEQGIDVQIPSQVPYLRELIEGRDKWSDSYFGTNELDLDDLEDASRTFPMMASIAVIILSKDGQIMLQRKSLQVQSSGGGVASSATGAVSWRDVTQWRFGHDPCAPRHFKHSTRAEQSRPANFSWLAAAHRSPKVGASFSTAILREVHEEVGLRRGDFFAEEIKTPFIGAALGLRYGRDLNFYALLHSNLESEEIVWRFLRRRGPGQRITHSRRDRWEVAHLFFVDPSHLGADGHLDDWLDDVIGDSRHVRGALHCVGVYLDSN